MTRKESREGPKYRANTHASNTHLTPSKTYLPKGPMRAGAAFTKGPLRDATGNLGLPL